MCLSKLEKLELRFQRLNVLVAQVIKDNKNLREVLESVYGQNLKLRKEKKKL